METKIKSQSIQQEFLNGWINASETWEYVSVDDPTGIFRVNADVTTKYSAGMRIKMTNGGNVIYGIITVVSAYEAIDAGYTHITFLHQIDPTDNLALYLMANSAITLPYYSTQKAPLGFPLEPTKWSIIITDVTQRIQVSPVNTVWYNLGSNLITIPIGIWNVDYCLDLFTSASSQEINFRSTLSTANNSESSKDWTCWLGHVGTVLYGTLSRQKILALTSKTPYYLNVGTTAASLTTIREENNNSSLFIRAVCAYL